jgi:N-acetylglucosamine-6-sulfatase
MRRALVLALGLLALLPALAHAQSRPNVLVIETDDQTVSDLANMPKTRALIAGQGVTFDQSIVSLSQCCPSRATFLTGRYAHNHRVLTTQPPFGGFPAFDDQETLPVWLQRAGYSTAIVGKYLNEYAKTDPSYVPPGWTDWHVLTGPTVYRFMGFDLDDGGVVHHVAGRYQTDVLTSVAQRTLRSLSQGRKPFFLWTTYVAPHVGTPHDLLDVRGVESTAPSTMYRDTFIGAQMPLAPAFNEADVSDKPRNVRRRKLLRPWQIARLEETWRQRQESLQSVDDGVERLMGTLRSLGELKDTLVIFTSDNGFMTGEHRIPFGKIVPYEESIRVPLLMRGPGVPRGEHRSQLVWNGDLAPTILRATGATAAVDPDGQPLQPFLEHPDAPSPHAVVIEGIPVSRMDPEPGFVGLRTPRYTYVEHHTGEVELYDLQRDPDELDNLAGTPGVAGVQAELAGELRRLRRCEGAGCRR